MISIEITDSKGGDARSLELFNTEAVIIFFFTGDLIAITLAYHALYVSVGFPIHTHKYARAAESRGYRGSAVPTIRPIPTSPPACDGGSQVGSAQVGRYVEYDSPRVSSGSQAAGLSRRLIVSAVMLNLARAQIASLVVIPPVRRTY